MSHESVALGQEEPQGLYADGWGRGPSKHTSQVGNVYHGF